MKLVLVHGRAQGGKDPEKLQKDWMAALGKGMAKAGVALPDGVEATFPFYGDKLDEMVEALRAPLVEDVMVRGADPDDAEAAFRGEFLAELAQQAGISDDDITALYAGDVVERGPLNWEWVQAMLKALDKTPLGERAVDVFTRDVYVYLTNRAVRRAIDGIVSTHLDDGPCVVVGHSLGSVVGYNVLARAARQGTVHRYVTVGSPLGLVSIRKRIEAPWGRPAFSGGWYNAFDERDVVALRPLTRGNFPVYQPITNKDDVDNHTKNRHGIAGYLDDPDVARAIVSALT